MPASSGVFITIKQHVTALERQRDPGCGQELTGRGKTCRGAEAVAMLGQLVSDICAGYLAETAHSIRQTQPLTSFPAATKSQGRAVPIV